ncbi:DUF5916 domain-containing protein [Aureicoccus marinus]|uniref:Hydrolase n=1 Tax=Aureicoccus marinus TaxID=754435 RepID=A0A2S7T7J7_9FLAO|nr:DUF5916 domain-containing protein [Aureicoccus marinus]PQJ15548.1 hydrolase [Aureicoccus marinus]
MPKNYISLFLSLISCFCVAQENQKSFVVRLIEEAPIIDGKLDEAFWEFAEAADSFQQYFPSDSIPATQTTSIKMVYDNKTLYIGITCKTLGDDYVIPSLQRDFRAGGNDNISLLFDTFNDGTNAFLFGINPLGVRREALITGGGSDLRGFTTSWDIKWKGETHIYENSYTAEIAIPLTSFKFSEGTKKWRFNSYRFDMQANERSTWAKIPQNQLIFNLAFMGDMVFEKPLGKSRTPLALIPYLTGITSRDFENQDSFNNFKYGGDAKVAIGNGMNLDVTINPDFSQVEVDNFITNLTRFEVSLPERRQFFIDNNDLFGNFGGGRDANPFFSRRIGIARDTAGNTIENRIIAGMRLSGKLSPTLRLGVLNIQTEEDAANEIASNNNLMVSLQQKVFARSNISAFFINRQSFDRPGFLPEEEEYNRVFGIDYNLANKDNSLIGKFYVHKSIDPDDEIGNFSFGANMAYNERNYSAVFDFVYIDEGFNSDLGFIPRKDIYKSAGFFSRRFWPKKGAINSHGLEFFTTYTQVPSLDFKNTDSFNRLSWVVNFNSLAELEVGFEDRYVLLLNDFEPTGADGVAALSADEDFRFQSVSVNFRSDRRKVFSYSLEPSYGEFFNGYRYSLQGRVNIRLQPKFNFSVRTNLDRIELPAPFGTADIILISPRIDYTLNKSLFWSTLVQYSNQRDNLGINSRLQWRFAPLSDLFLVYTDNYFVSPFLPQQRTINLKLTYWLNL